MSFGINAADLIVGLIVLVAVVVAVINVVKRKGKCSCCSGTCPGCSAMKKEK